MLGQWYAQGTTLLRSMNSHWDLAAKSLQNVSTGTRINRAADDAAGLAIAEKMKAQMNGFGEAGKNIQDGISLVQTAEGSLQQTHTIVHRMRELAVQASNDTLTNDNRSLLDLEFQQLKKEIDRIAQNTEFNTKKLLSGDYEHQALHFQVGANKGQTIGLFIKNMGAVGIGLSNHASITTRENANEMLAFLDEAVKHVSSERSMLGATQNRLEHSYNIAMTSFENISTAKSRIADADIAKEMLDFTKLNLLNQVSQQTLSMHMQQAERVLHLLK